MRKKFLILCLSALVIFTCIFPASGTELVCFVGVNDTIPTSLPGEAIPYYDNGALYLPYTAFDAGPAGIFTSYNVDQNNFVLANRGQRLVYELLNGTVTDETGTVTEAAVSYRGGLLFVPANFTASHFGLSVSVLTSASGCPIIRFTDGSEVYDDAHFVEKAETLINYMLEHYANQEEDRPQNPDPGAPDSNKDGDSDEEQEPGVTYLSFAGAAVCKETLKHLEALDCKAVFFVTETQLKEEKELIRQIYGSGHTIGITVEAGEPDYAAGLQQANEALDQCIFSKTLLALVPDSQQPAGYVIWSESLHGSTVEEILSHPEEPHLLICREDILKQLKTLTSVEMKFPLLLETTQLN